MRGAKIIDRGRGAEIEGLRITVYDIVGYLQEGWRYDQVTGLFRLPRTTSQPPSSISKPTKRTSWVPIGGA
jgi:hypothetical protein